MANCPSYVHTSTSKSSIHLHAGQNLSLESLHPHPYCLRWEGGLFGPRHQTICCHSQSLEFLNFLCKFMLSSSKSLQNNLSYAFTPNIRDVMKVYNPGYQSSETDFGAYEIEYTGNRY